jgi:diguanylate cyclase
MNHNDLPLVHSNRPASRRLHRRLAHSSVLPCVPGLSVFHSTSETVVSLPKEIVQQAGMFELLAAELRIAELEKELAEVRAVACADPLTGALNRRGFDKASQRELARVQRSGNQFALAYIDLDDFKRVNDTLGHHAGDAALIHLVGLLHKAMRPTDVLCRLGGEEFLLMLPDTNLEEGVTAISRFLDEFSAQLIPGTDCQMTFSAGVVVHGLDETIDETIQRADTAAYAAKRAGKNCVQTG